MASSTASSLRNRKWTQDAYLISTDASLVPVHDLTAVFASADAYWAKPLPEAATREMLHNSLCFGLYDLGKLPPSTTTTTTTEELLRKTAADNNSPIPAFIGFARLVTDFTTFAYLTDVWVHPSTQGKGLGSWLVRCVREVVEGMPHLRRSMLLTGDWERSVPFYERLMKMEVMGGKPGELAVMQMRWKGHPDWIEKEGD